MPEIHANLDLSRRQVIRAGSLLGAAWLAGCASPRPTESLPGPVTQGTSPSPVGLPPAQPPAPAPTAYDLRPRSAWTKAGIARPKYTRPLI